MNKDTPFGELIERAQKEGFQAITRTSTGTYYLKCHKDEVSLYDITETLRNNKNANYKKKSMTWVTNWIQV